MDSSNSFSLNWRKSLSYNIWCLFNNLNTTKRNGDKGTPLLCLWEVQIRVFLLSPPTKSRCLHESMDLVFFKVFRSTIQHVPEVDTVNWVFVLHWIVHGVLEKGFRNIWSHIPWDLQKIGNLLMPRKSQGIVNPGARARVRRDFVVLSSCDI